MNPKSTNNYCVSRFAGLRKDAFYVRQTVERDIKKGESKHSPQSLVALFWFSNSCDSCPHAIVSLDQQRWPFSPFCMSPEYNRSLGEKNIPKARFLVVARSQRIRRRNRRIGWKCATQAVSRQSSKVWHLYGIFRFSLLLLAEWKFVEGRKNEIIGLSLSTTTEENSPKQTKSTRHNNPLSIESKKWKMSTGNTPTILQSTFLGGSAAVFAVNFTHPIELVKSRVQVNNMGVIQTCSDTLKNEGFAAFWKVRANLCLLMRFLMPIGCPPRKMESQILTICHFLLVFSFSNLFWSGTAMGLLPRRKVRKLFDICWHCCFGWATPLSNPVCRRFLSFPIHLSKVTLRFVLEVSSKLSTKLQQAR